MCASSILAGGVRSPPGPAQPARSPLDRRQRDSRGRTVRRVPLNREPVRDEHLPIAGQRDPALARRSPPRGPDDDEGDGASHVLGGFDALEDGEQARLQRLVSVGEREILGLRQTCRRRCGRSRRGRRAARPSSLRSSQASPSANVAWRHASTTPAFVYSSLVADDPRFGVGALPVRRVDAGSRRDPLPACGEARDVSQWHLERNTLRQRANVAVRRGIAEVDELRPTKTWRLTSRGRALLESPAE